MELYDHAANIEILAVIAVGVLRALGLRTLAHSVESVRCSRQRPLSEQSGSREVAALCAIRKAAHAEI